MGVPGSLSIVALTIAATAVIVLVAIALPGAPKRRPVPTIEQDRRPRIRLLSRLLFARSQPDSITLDCLLVAIEEAGPGATAPEGLPFTLQLRAPNAGWFADRVEQLLSEWANDTRELHVELREDHGKVSTVLESRGSSVHLELAGAAGLRLRG